MRTVYIIIIFIISVLSAFFITKAVLDKPVDNPVKKGIKKNTNTIPVQDTVDVSKSSTIPDSKSVETLKMQEKEKTIEKEKDKDNKESNIKEEVPQKHVNISCSEMKQLIVKGTYVRDRRLSKKYRIEYVDVSDDDALEGLQQNLTYIQQRVEFGDDDDNGWRGFEVVGLDFDDQGLVNCIKIKPIY